MNNRIKSIIIFLFLLVLNVIHLVGLWVCGTYKGTGILFTLAVILITVILSPKIK